MTDNNKTVRKPISAPAEWWEDLETYSKQHNLSRSAVIRLAVDAFKKKNTQNIVSFL